MNLDGFVKSPSAALRFNFVVAAHLVSALHSSVFARLASGAFYETIVLETFYEIINLMSRKNEFLEHLLDLLRDFGPVTARGMFGGYGIYKQGRMFAIVIDDTLFFKADERTKKDFESKGLSPFTYRRKNREISLSYYQAPEEALEDRVVMRHSAEKAYAASLGAIPKNKKA